MLNGQDERTALIVGKTPLKQSPLTVWLTGLSGSGKTTVAYAVENWLINAGYSSCVLDGDNIRHGLSKDLDFSPAGRTENIRRVANVARLMNDAGLIVISAFISPLSQDREMARQIIGTDRFFEIFLKAPIEVCESRDPKGLYAKARRGEILDFTGIDAPYEVPVSPDLALNTGVDSLEDCLDRLLGTLLPMIQPASPLKPAFL